MKFLRNPFVAIIIALIVICASTLLSFEIRFGSKCQEVADGFIDGVYFNGDFQPGLASRVRSIIEYTKDIKLIADTYGADTEELGVQIQDTDNAMTYSATDADFIHYCYEDLMAALNGVKAELRAMELDADTEAELSYLYAGIKAEEDAFDTSGYNESVREFLREYENKFPVSILYWHTNVMMPGYFA